MDSLFGLERVSAHDDTLALLTTVYDRAQQMIVESILQDARIPYLVKERGSGSMVKVIAGYSMFGTDIFVRCEQLETAAELIDFPALSEGNLAEEEEENEKS